MIKLLKTTLILSSILVTSSYADKLVYIPVNPSFGGNPLNGTILLNEANAQNSFTDPNASAQNSFQSRLTQAIQSKIITTITDNIKTDANGNIIPTSSDVLGYHFSVNADGSFTVTNKADGSSVTGSLQQ